VSLFDELLAIRDRQRAVIRSQSIVVRDADRPWEQNVHGKMKWYLHPSVESVCNAYVVYRQELPPRTKSGRQRCQGGVLFYMLEGHARTRIDDEIYEWGPGDLLTLPILRDGVVFQHLNLDEATPARFLACEANTVLSLGVDKGSGFEELEPAGPLAPSDLAERLSTARRDGIGYREPPRHLDPAESQQYDRDIERWQQIQRRHATGRLLIRGADMSWEQNKQGRVRYYLNPEYEGNALRDWTLFLHDIRTHTGTHRHQGGLVIYVVEGEGYTICDGERYDWAANDLVVLPVKPDGLEHKHYNKRAGESCQWIAIFSWSWWELVASEFFQLELHPDYRERGRERLV
jgi:gentisate 1,2-dioxygenase